MARLPDPVTEELVVDWDEDYKGRDKTINNMAAIAIRKAIRAKEKKEEEKEDKD